MTRKRLSFWLIIALVAVLLVWVFRQAGSSLVKADPQQKSDAIVVLMGSVPDRVLHATDLYQQGIAPRIIIIDPEHGSWEKVIARGIKPVFGAVQFANVAVQLGVPDSCLMILSGEAKSTNLEAQIISEWLKKNPSVDTLTLVSTNNHSLRAGMIFRKKIRKEGLNVQVRPSPSPYSQYNDLRKWWSDREKIEIVVFEWIKIAVFVFVEQWTL